MDKSVHIVANILLLWNKNGLRYGNNGTPTSKKSKKRYDRQEKDVINKHGLRYCTQNTKSKKRYDRQEKDVINKTTNQQQQKSSKTEAINKMTEDPISETAKDETKPSSTAK